MRICHVITALTWGGAETQTVALATRQRALGHQVLVVSMTIPQAFEPELASAGVEVKTLGMKKGTPSLRALRTLAHIYRTWKPDVVHTQMFHSAILGRASRMLAPVPRLISTLHTTRDRQSWAPLALRLTDRWCDLTTGVSEAVVDRYVAIKAVPAAKMRCVYNGVDTEKFQFDASARAQVRSELGVKERDFFWLAAGRLVEPKDYPTLIRAAQLVKNLLPTTTFLVVIAGIGPLKDELEAQVVAAGLSDRLRFLGLRNDLPAVMSAADGYVLSSAWEGFGLVLAEALSVGLPVVSTDCGGTRDILEGGRWGALVPVGAPALLAAAMVETMGQVGGISIYSPEVAPAGISKASPSRDTATTGRDSISERFGFDRIITTWERLYSRVQKIAFVVTRGDSIGGAQIHVRDLAGSLAQRGIEVRVFVGSSGDLTRQLDERGIAWDLVPGLVRSINPFNDLVAIFRLSGMLRRFGPSLVSTHTAKSGLVGRWAAFFAGIPAMFTAHGWQFADGISPLQKALVLGVEKVSAPISKRIVTVSQYDYDLAIQNHIVSPDRLRLIHNGMPDRAAPKRSVSADAANSPAASRLIMVARFQEQKDHACLFAALAEITDLPWTLDLVGDGPLLETMRNLARSLGIAERIRFLGQRLDVPDMLEKSDIFVLATRWEGFPRSILEAMRASLPVIASDVGGVHESVVHGETGLLVPAGSIRELKDALRSLMADPVRARALGQAGRARFDAHFTFDAMFKKTWQIYEELV